MARSSQSDSTSRRQKKKCKPEKPKSSQDKAEDKCGSSPANPEPTRSEPNPYYGTEGFVAKIREKSTKNVTRIRNILKNMNLLLKTVDEMEGQCCKNRYHYDRSTDPYDPDPYYEYDQYDYSYYDVKSPQRQQQEYCQYGGRYGKPEEGGRKGFDDFQDGLPGGDSPFGQPRPRRPDREYDGEPSFRGREETFGSGSGDEDMPGGYGRRPPAEPRSRAGPRERRPRERRPRGREPQHPDNYGGYGFNPPRTKPGERREQPSRPHTYDDNPYRRSGGPEYGSPGGRPRGPPGGNRRGSQMGYVQQDSKLEACRDWPPSRGREERRGDFGNRSPRRDDYGGRGPAEGPGSRGPGGCGPGGCRPGGRGEPGDRWPRGRGPGGRGEPGGHGEHGGHKPEYRGGPRDGYRRGDTFDGSSGFSGSSDDELGDSQFRNMLSNKSRPGRHNIFDGEPDKRKIVGTECDPYFYTQMTAAQINQHIKEEAKDGFVKGKDFYMPFTYWLLKTNNTNTIKILPLLIKPPRHMQNQFTFRYVKDFYDNEPLLLPQPVTDGRAAAKILLQIKDAWKLSKKQVQDKREWKKKQLAVSKSGLLKKSYKGPKPNVEQSKQKEAAGEHYENAKADVYSRRKCTCRNDPPRGPMRRQEAFFQTLDACRHGSSRKNRSKLSDEDTRVFRMPRKRHRNRHRGSNYPADERHSRGQERHQRMYDNRGGRGREYSNRRSDRFRRHSRDDSYFRSHRWLYIPRRHYNRKHRYDHGHRRCPRRRYSRGNWRPQYSRPRRRGDWFDRMSARWSQGCQRERTPRTLRTPGRFDNSSNEFPGQVRFRIRHYDIIDPHRMNPKVERYDHKGPLHDFPGEPENCKITSFKCQKYYYTHKTREQILRRIKREAVETYMPKRFYMPYRFWLITDGDRRIIKIQPLIIRPPKSLSKYFEINDVKEFQTLREYLDPVENEHGRNLFNLRVSDKRRCERLKEKISDAYDYCLYLLAYYR